ncbi:unnamed protein product [Orchesella dallaii]|uniref:Uncharacterized protein n=1 Tax=Orchesella dallaii TaxID=48710 RepID=A0ABP1PM61_9HEXA
MEKWQKDIITDNITELVENTECTVLLLSKLEAAKLLDKANVQEINACRTDFEKSKCLYNKIVTKDNSFNTLVNALDETTQTGASKILKRNSGGGGVGRPTQPPAMETQKPIRLEDLDDNTTLKLYRNGSEITLSDAKSILKETQYKLVTEVFTNPGTNDLLTINEEFGLDPSEIVSLNLKPVTTIEWAGKFVNILSNRWGKVSMLVFI